jgi:poly-gamma-glutamate synthesis protein (capsule biosynthesis protein)
MLTSIVIPLLAMITANEPNIATSAPGYVEPTQWAEPRSVRLIFAGDVMSHSPQIEAARSAGSAAGTRTGTDTGPTHASKTAAGYDYSEVFRHFKPIFEAADVAVANLETTLRNRPPYTGYPSFAAPGELAFELRRAGIDIVTTANNHICDKGAAGIRSTLAILDSAGLAHTGVFLDSADWRARNPLRFVTGGLRVALLSYTYGTNGLPVPRGMIVNKIDDKIIARDIAAARAGSYVGVGAGSGVKMGEGGEGADVVIVSYHWGDEYRSQPNAEQRRLAELTYACGADIIIGGHPHVVEPVVGSTYYSLGNFVSNQRERRTDGGIVADITITRRNWGPGGSGATTSERPRLEFNFGWHGAWVHKYFEGGRRHYQVLPMPVTTPSPLRDSSPELDSFPAFDSLPAPARSAARLFESDTRTLLSGGL